MSSTVCFGLRSDISFIFYSTVTLTVTFYPKIWHVHIIRRKMHQCCKFGENPSNTFMISC